MEVQRPKRQVSSEAEGEVLSSSAGTADSPELYVKSTGSDDPSNDALTPDLSPPSSSPPHTPPPPARPTQRNKSACFHRQSAVDHGDRGKDTGERGEKVEEGGQVEIKVLMERGNGGREGGGGEDKGEYSRANSWSEDKRRGLLSKGGGGVNERGVSRTNGHKHSALNHKSQEHGSSNHRQARGDRRTESSSSAFWTSRHRGMHGRGGRLLEQDEEKISNYEMEMKPLQPRDSTTHKPQGNGEERLGYSHAHGEGRSHAVQRQSHKSRLGREGRERREGDKDLVHKLDRLGEKMDSRPLRRDLTLSPPLKSSPITPEQQDHSLTQGKGNSVSVTLNTRLWRFCRPYLYTLTLRVNYYSDSCEGMFNTSKIRYSYRIKNRNVKMTMINQHAAAGLYVMFLLPQKIDVLKQKLYHVRVDHISVTSKQNSYYFC